MTGRDDHCRTLIAVARQLALPEQMQRHGAQIAWTAAGGETTWRNLANDGSSTLVKLGTGQQLTAHERAVARESLAFPHDGIGRNLDSVGILQQRPGTGWGTPAELMQPMVAFEKFFHGAGGNPGLLDQAGWQADEVWRAAWLVQRSGPNDIHVYQNAAVAAAQDIARLWATTPGASHAPDFEEFEMPGYQVLRRNNGVDYAIGTDTFFPIRDPDHYHFLTAAGLIRTPHNAAPVVGDDLLEELRQAAEKGGRVGDLL